MQWVLKLEKVIEGKVINRRTVTRLNLPDSDITRDDIGSC